MNRESTLRLATRLLRPAELIDRFIESLSHREAVRRVRAARRLGELRAARAHDALVVAMIDPELPVRLASSRALLEIGRLPRRPDRSDFVLLLVLLAAIAGWAAL